LPRPLAAAKGLSELDEDALCGLCEEMGDDYDTAADEVLRVVRVAAAETVDDEYCRLAAEIAAEWRTMRAGVRIVGK